METTTIRRPLHKLYDIPIVFQKSDTLFQLINELIPSICKSNDIEPPSSTQNVSLEKFYLSMKFLIQFLVRLLPANRRTDPLMRPYIYISGRTPLNVLRKAAGSPRKWLLPEFTQSVINYGP